MKTKYKSSGLRTLATLSLALAVATLLLGSETASLVAALAALGSTLALLRPGIFKGWLPIAIGCVAALMALIPSPAGGAWLWLLALGPMAASSRSLPLVTLVSALVGGGLVWWRLPLPEAILASAAFAIVLLMSLDRQRRSRPQAMPEAIRWLQPASSLATGIQSERRRVERENLYGEVAVFGCLHTTSADLEQLSQLLRQNLELYEPAYWQGTHQVAVLLIAANPAAARKRAQRLEHAVTPHLLLHTTPLTDHPASILRPRRFWDYLPEALPWR